MGDLVNLKEKYTFKLPSTVPLACEDESEIQTLGESLFKLGLLKLLPTEGVKEIKRNAFRLMTILNPKKEVSDEYISKPEINLYEYIEKCRNESPALEETEGNPYDTTTVFSSLGLLWNIKQCQMNQFEVPVSADGTDHTTSNNYQLLHFGTFSRNEKGQQSYRPMVFILGAGERRTVFAIGMVVMMICYDCFHVGK